MFLYALFFVCVIHFVKNEESPFTRKSLEESWEERLMKDLNSRHTASNAPNETTEISAHFFLKHFTMGEDETTFQAFSWLILTWNDPRLKWNVKDYYGISEVIYDDFLQFWKPRLRLLNYEVNMQEFELPYGLCSLDKDGDMTCIPRVLHEAPCNTILTNWPYDFQKCTLQMGFFTVKANINLRKIKKAATLLGAEYGNEWTILDYSESYKTIDSPVRNSDKGSQYDLTFLILREGEGLGAIVIFPTILLSMLTLSSLLLSVKDNVRLGIICFNLMCHFLFVTELSDLIPKHSENSPTILFYLRDSVVINIMLIIFTIFLIALRKKTVPLPTWISVVNSTVLKSRGSFLVWPRWEVEFQEGTSEEIQIILRQWADFSVILNSACLWLVTFLYLFYICVYIPRPVGNMKL